MNENNDDRVDILLRRNVESQLADFDWEGLRRSIDGRLAGCDVPVRLWIRYGKWGAVAAVVSLTVGVLAFAVVHTMRPGPENLPAGEVKVTMIETVHTAGTARVSLTPTKKPSRCEVRILASDAPRAESGVRARWCIIVAQTPSVKNNRDGHDASDILCLF